MPNFMSLTLMDIEIRLLCKINFTLFLPEVGIGFVFKYTKWTYTSDYQFTFVDSLVLLNEFNYFVKTVYYLIIYFLRKSWNSIIIILHLLFKLLIYTYQIVYLYISMQHVHAISSRRISLKRWVWRKMKK